MIQLFIAVIVVLLSSGVASGTEAALFSVSIIRVRQLAESNNRAAQALLSIRDNMSRPIASIVILNNIANIVGSIVVGSIATSVLGDRWLGLFSGVLTFLVIIFSEIIPKTLGERYSERIALVAARPVLGLTVILTPIVWLVEKITSPITKGTVVAPTTNEAEIKLLAKIGHQEGIIEAGESEMIQRIFTLNDMAADQMMTPRVAMTHLEGNMTLVQVQDRVIASPHSRIVVIGETIDDVLGVVLKGELLTALIQGGGDRTVLSLAREVKLVPQKTPANKLLGLFRQGRQHLAVVMDEFSGIAGVVTLEDVLETLIGHIIDETDKHVDLREASRKRLIR